MTQESLPSTEEIQELADRCEALIQETRRVKTLLSRARRYEFRNIRSVLMGLLDLPGSFPAEKIKELFENVRERVQGMIDNPQNAGHHNHMLHGKK
ncbi:hypothetical protein JW752_04270 [Candidatus Peregrinibacteria bacterium]|nr:hypothetical protein [Candidatus Peregrinibacteria bacterium]